MDEPFDVPSVKTPQKKRKSKKPKNYGDQCQIGRAKVGDVVYMPSNPEVKMTVKEVCNYNFAANHSSPEVMIQWLNTAGELTEATVFARTLLLAI